jgi:uncharacterized protein (DUF608 family)
MAARRGKRQDSVFNVGPQRTFTGEHRAQIAFPLGGIGTGSISLGGWGQLRDFEIFNRPAKGQNCYGTFLTLFAQRQDDAPVTRVLQGPVAGPAEYSHGFPRDSGAGLPHFAESTFTGTFPMARIDFRDHKVPLAVSLEAFNPMIPMAADDSSIPAAILLVNLRNPSRTKSVKATLFANLQNRVGHPDIGGNVNEFVDERSVRGLRMTTTKHAPDAPQFGSMALATPWRQLQVQTRWPRVTTLDQFELFWNEASRGKLPERRDRTESDDGQTDVGSIALDVRLPPGQSRTLPIIIAWHFPNVRKYWDTAFGIPECCTPEQPVWRNAYASLFEDAWDVAATVAKNLPRLEARTRRFADTLYSSTLPATVLDAAGSQLAVLKSTTCLRLEDGSFYGWEGCHPGAGCCEGTCSHVWNYAQALPNLYPGLQASTLENHLTCGLGDDGKMDFRQRLPLDAKRPVSDFHAAADGQMGIVLNVYRHWQLTGDDAWLRAWWPRARKALEYAWVHWDADRDGVMEGLQHNTYDIEFYGPNTMMTSLYLAALRAGEVMARRCDEPEAAEEYAQVYESGRARVDETLWGEDYYVQRIDPRAADASPLKGQLFRTDPEESGLGSDEPPHQFGVGCLSDQLIGQWYAHMLGFGHVLDPSHVRRAMKSVFRYNFRGDLREHANTERIYALGDEAGLLLCTWPHGDKEPLPFIYAHEVFPGIEYQVACHLIYEGLTGEGLRIVKAVRDRHNGYRRNPWNEVECGNHYARSMASWSLIDALGGFRYSAVEKRIEFAPRLNADDFRSLFTAGNGWGAIRQRREKRGGRIDVELIEGKVPVRHIIIDPGQKASTMHVTAHLGKRTRRCTTAVRSDGRLEITLARATTLRAGATLRVRWRPMKAR